MNKLILSTFLISTHFCSDAQPFIDSFDIYPGKNGSNPAILCTHGKDLYFAASDSVHGGELWVKSPDASLPKRLTDIKPGTYNSLSLHTNSIASLGSTVYFAAMDDTHAMELWSCDANGNCKMVKDIYVGIQGSGPGYMLPHNGKLYFTARSASHLSELWSYEPATDKAERLTSIGTSTLSSNIQEPVVYNNKIYFRAGNTQSGIELYEYDPVGGTTQMIADINSGTVSSNPGKFIVFNNKLYFQAKEDATGYELYVWDGTNLVTRLTDLRTGPTADGLYNRKMAQLNGKLYFCGYDAGSGFYQLMEYNPSTNNTSLVYTIANAGKDPSIDYLTNYNGAIFFKARDANHGDELWRYDGMNNPSMVADIYPGTMHSAIYDLTDAWPNLYFSARNESYGIELFRYTDYAAGVENASRAENVKIYPNPAKDIAHLEINLKHNQTLELTLTDMNGRTVYKTGKVLYSAAKHTIDIPLQNLPPGNYVYSLQDVSGNLVATGKLVKQ